MATAPKPRVECEQQHTSVFVSDLARAIDFYVTKLGFTPTFQWGDPPSFAGVKLDHAEIFLDASRPPNPAGCCLFFVVRDVDELYDFHRAQAVEVAQEIGDRPWHMRDYTVRDLDGHPIVFGQHRLDAGPPVEIERVELAVRLERRLAALLQDLAAHKRMTLSSCLEEILLHTNDGAGPHTDATLRHIQELKRKHGIDYDTHASYRFAET